VRDLDAEQVAQARGHGLEEPDVHHGRGQVDVAHALATHAAVRDHHAALVAHDALVLDALVLAAEALPVLLRTEDALAEQAVALGPVGAVVDRLGLLHFAVGPGTDVLRRGEVDRDAAVVVDACVDRVSHHTTACFLWSSMLRARPLISLHSTSKETGVPGSRMFRPLTMDS